MIMIRPVSDLRNKFPEIEKTVSGSNSPVFLTKNGYGTMVLMSLEQYSALTDTIEKKNSMKRMRMLLALLPDFPMPKFSIK